MVFKKFILVRNACVFEFLFLTYRKCVKVCYYFSALLGRFDKSNSKPEIFDLQVKT